MTSGQAKGETVEIVGTQPAEIARWICEQGLTHGDIEHFDQFVSPHLVWHAPGGEFEVGALRGFLAGAHTRLPGLEVRIEDQITELDRVATRVSLSWVDPSNTRTAQVTGVVIDRIVDNRITERWDFGEAVVLMAELGLVRSHAGPVDASGAPDESHWRTPQHVMDEILEESQTVAVVGMSTDESKYAHAIPLFLHDAGFTVIPVHPTATEISGLSTVRSLADIDQPVDVVDVFRPADEAPGIAVEAASIGAKALWLQKDIKSAEARHIAADAGLKYVEDHCMGLETARQGISKAAD